MAFGLLYEELEGSPTYNLTRREITAKRLLKVPWADLDLAVAQFSPTPYNLLASFPGRPLLWVDTIDVEPWEGTPPYQGGPPNFYDWAKFTVNYKTRTWENSAKDNSPRQGNDPKAGQDTFLSHKISLGGEFLVLSTKSLEWDNSYDAAAATYGSGSKRVLDDVAAGILVPHIEHTITWHYVAFPPWTAIRTTIGKVNQGLFAGCPEGTLLFLGCDASVDLSMEDTKFWTIEYKFSYKNSRYLVPSGFNIDKGWNYFLRPETGDFEKLNIVARVKVTEHRGPLGEKQPDEVEILSPAHDIYEMKPFQPLFMKSLL